jgi:hypothetical protein
VGGPCPALLLCLGKHSYDCQVKFELIQFIRRFLIHVSSTGFHRIRHYGLLASGVKADNLMLARKLLNVAPPAPEPEDIAAQPPTPLEPCPCCGSAMRIIEMFNTS